MQLSLWLIRMYKRQPLRALLIWPGHLWMVSFYIVIIKLVTMCLVVVYDRTLGKNVHKNNVNFCWKIIKDMLPIHNAEWTEQNRTETLLTCTNMCTSLVQPTQPTYKHKVTLYTLTPTIYIQFILIYSVLNPNKDHTLWPWSFFIKPCKYHLDWYQYIKLKSVCDFYMYHYGRAGIDLFCKLLGRVDLDFEVDVIFKKRVTLAAP